jgi:hypothetical protein
VTPHALVTPAKPSTPLIIPSPMFKTPSAVETITLSDSPEKYKEVCGYKFRQFLKNNSKTFVFQIQVYEFVENPSPDRILLLGTDYREKIFDVFKVLKK